MLQDYLTSCIERIEEIERTASPNSSTQQYQNSYHHNQQTESTGHQRQQQQQQQQQNQEDQSMIAQEKIAEHEKAGTPTDVRDVHF